MCRTYNLSTSLFIKIVRHNLLYQFCFVYARYSYSMKNVLVKAMSYQRKLLHGSSHVIDNEYTVYDSNNPCR